LNNIFPGNSPNGLAYIPKNNTGRLQMRYL
jgi:hypothetical protein